MNAPFYSLTVYNGSNFTVFPFPFLLVNAILVDGRHISSELDLHFPNGSDIKRLFHMLLLSALQNVYFRSLPSFNQVVFVVDDGVRF